MVKTTEIIANITMSTINKNKSIPHTAQLTRKPDLCYSLETVMDKLKEKAKQEELKFKR